MNELLVGFLRGTQGVFKTNRIFLWHWLDDLFLSLLINARYWYPQQPWNHWQHDVLFQIFICNDSGFKNDNNDVRMLNIPLKLIILLAASFGGGRAQPIRISHCIQSKRNQVNVVFEKVRMMVIVGWEVKHLGPKMIWISAVPGPGSAFYCNWM